jgi:outer membrane protein OmpA-like peptidoglycan-associated protein
LHSIFITSLSALILMSGCSSSNKNTYAGAGIGTAVGAGVGALIGKEKGAMIGAAVGGGLGAYAGNRMDKQAAELKKIAETKRTEQGLVTKLKSDILFDSGKAELKPAAKANLKEMGEIMKKYPENVLTVKGYTDNTGTSATNERLSSARALAVKQELIKAGISEKVITVLGMGPAQPIADNATSEGRSQNRRVEIEITVDESKLPKKKK